MYSEAHVSSESKNTRSLCVTGFDVKEDRSNRLREKCSAMPHLVQYFHQFQVNTQVSISGNENLRCR